MDAISNALVGMQVTTARFDAAARSIADGSPSGDVATDMVAVLTAPIAYAANARVVDAARATHKSLLDALA